jgi:hypothetical protein
VTDYSVNPERGEVAIVLDGATYPMRPSYEAQVAIEEQTGVSIDELTLRLMRLSNAGRNTKLASGAGLKLSEMAAIVTECVKACGKERNDKTLMDFKAARVGVLLSKNRFAANQPISTILGNMLFGGADPKKDGPENPETSTSGLDAT